jgi:ferric-dicitrate binding protein FerR (iron transport regulator)
VTADRNELLAPLLRLARETEAPDAEVTARVEGAVAGAWRREVARRRYRRLAAAAGIAALLAAGWLLAPPSWQPWRDPGGTEARIARSEGTIRWSAAEGSGEGSLAPGSVLETAASGRARIELPGSEEIRIAGDTRLAYLGPRSLRLDHGRLYFDSHRAGEEDPGGEEPVVVETPHGPVRNLGTRYEIRVTGERLEIAVRTGSVERIADDGTVTRVTAGHLAWLGGGGATGEQPLAPTSERWQWTAELSDPFPTEGRTLADLLAWVEAETGLETRWQAPADPDTIALRGDLVARDPLQAADVALRMSGLAWEERDGVLWVSGR